MAEKSSFVHTWWLCFSGKILAWYPIVVCHLFRPWRCAFQYLCPGGKSVGSSVNFSPFHFSIALFRFPNIPLLRYDYCTIWICLNDMLEECLSSRLGLGITRQVDWHKVAELVRVPGSIPGTAANFFLVNFPRLFHAQGFNSNFSFHTKC